MKINSIISEDDGGTCSSSIAAAPAQNLFAEPQKRVKEGAKAAPRGTNALHKAGKKAVDNIKKKKQEEKKPVTESRNHFMGKFSKGGETYTLWQEADYYYKLTNSAQNANGNFDTVKTFDDMSSNEVLDWLSARDIHRVATENKQPTRKKWIIEGADKKLKMVSAPASWTKEQVQESTGTARITEAPMPVRSYKVGGPDDPAVKAKLRGQKQHASMPPAETKQVPWQAVVNALSNSYPDLDPTDSLQPIMKKYGVSFEYLEKLAQKNGYADMWAVLDDFNE
jgi:hypothetical protein